MELRQLEYFLAIVERGNMSEAAKHLHISQPSLSVSLRNLEAELGTQLFDRKGRNLVINDDGIYLAGQARIIQSILAESVAAIEKKDLDRSSTVNCVHRMPVGDVGALIKGFAQAYPDYRVRIGFPESSMFTLSSVDVEFIGSLSFIDDDSYIFVAEDCPVVFLPQEHRLASVPFIRPRDLASDDFVVAAANGREKPGSTLEGKALHYLLCGQEGISPSVACETQFFSEALDLVDRGVGCCFGFDLSWLAGTDHQFVVKPLICDFGPRYIYLRLPHGTHASKATWAFADYVQDYFESVPVYLEKHYGYTRA